jgi:Flp pilus assembly protein TadB
MNVFKMSNTDAAILEITPSFVTQMAIRRTLITICGIALLLFLWSMRIQDFPSLTLVMMATFCLGIVPWHVFRQVSQAAHKRRADMNMAVAVFLDLVNVLLAGGAGIETAILTAASAGDGWSFDYIRRTLARAQSSRENYWDALDRAGDEIEVQSLQDVAQSIRIAGEHGGRIRQSLTSRADALRKNNLAFIEHEAQRRTERMGIPMVAMFVGFVIFIGYPAFVTTVTAL